MTLSLYKLSYTQPNTDYLAQLLNS